MHNAGKRVIGWLKGLDSVKPFLVTDACVSVPVSNREFYPRWYFSAGCEKGNGSALFHPPPTPT